jgi:hypothetical protein
MSTAAARKIDLEFLVRTKWKSDVTKAIVGRTERFQDNTKFSVEIANVDTKFLALVLCGGVLML